MMPSNIEKFTSFTEFHADAHFSSKTANFKQIS